MGAKDSLSNIEKAEFLRRVGLLIRQGYTISECIELFMKYEKEKFKPVLKHILSELNKGSSFSQALLLLQLPKNITSFVYFAEHYGDLAKGLIDGGTLLAKTEKNKKALQKMIKYPLFLLWVLIIFLIIMYQHIFPQFKQLYLSLNIQLPFVTRLLLNIVKKSPFLIIIFLFVIISLLVYYLGIFRKKDEADRTRTISFIPIFGYYYRMVITYFFASNLSCLISSGMSIYDALTLFKDQDKISYIRINSGKIIEHLEQGEPLQRVLIEETIYLEQLAYIVEHGQKNGRLDEELNHYSDWLLVEFEQKLKRLFMMIQPILFLFIGAMILLLFAAVLIPIFTIINGL